MSKSGVVRERPRVQIFFEGEGRTKQSFKNESDVNFIMAKYGANRLLEHYSQYQGNYGDFTNVQDYQTSMNQIIEANNMFMSLPANVRNRFANDPAQFLDFVSKDENRAEMKTLGLLKEEVAPSISEAPMEPKLDKTDPD